MKSTMQKWVRALLIAGFLVSLLIPYVQAAQVDEEIDHIVNLPLVFRNAGAPAKIYFSVYEVLYRMNLDGTDLETVVTGAPKSELLAVDSIHQKIYLSHWFMPGQVLIYDLQGGVSGKIEVDGPGEGGQGIAVDPVSSKVYLGLYYDGVFVKNLNSNDAWIQLVFASSLFPLHGQRGQLQIDPDQQHIYFRTSFNGECGLCRYIYRVDFNGDNLNPVIPANGGDALVLDLVGRKMYYSDVPGNGTIMRANMDGTGIETLFSIPAPYQACRAIALDLAHQKIYLSLYDEDHDWKARAIARANLDGSEYEILHEMTGITGDELSGGIGLFLP